MHRVGGKRLSIHVDDNLTRIAAAPLSGRPGERRPRHRHERIRAPRADWVFRL